MPVKKKLPVVVPSRVRQPSVSFAWIDHRLRSSGLLSMLEPSEVGLYVFLVLAADRDGLSCWRLDRIEREICFNRNELWNARDRLVALDLIAFKPWRTSDPDGIYQVLSLKRSGAALSPQMNEALASLGARLQSQ